MSSVNGFLIIHKPVGPTSHDIVARIRELIGIRRVGHTGTLDPLASGVLVLALGDATKAAQFLSGCDKSYDAEIQLGRVSSTYDAERVDWSTPESTLRPVEAEILAGLAGFIGAIDQAAPAFSAVKVQGQPLYKLARRGQTVTAPIRRVRVDAIRLVSYEWPFARVIIDCGSGVYVRSLAHDMGQRLGTGAFLSRLSRVRVGRFTLENALTLEECAGRFDTGTLGDALISVTDALDIPLVTIEDAFTPRVRQGVAPRSANIAAVDRKFDVGAKALLRNRDNEALAIVCALTTSDQAMGGAIEHPFRYLRVF